MRKNNCGKQWPETQKKILDRKTFGLSLSLSVSPFSTTGQKTLLLLLLLILLLPLLQMLPLEFLTSVSIFFFIRKKKQTGNAISGW